MSTACTAPTEAIWPSSNFHSGSQVRMTTRLILPFLVLNSLRDAESAIANLDGNYAEIFRSLQISLPSCKDGQGRT